MVARSPSVDMDSENSLVHISLSSSSFSPPQVESAASLKTNCFSFTDNNHFPPPLQPTRPLASSTAATQTEKQAGLHMQI
ncbi:hypothetical protein Q5P01_025079 [Channa striata]|uniref:Uncharacterized protein n=1 Tax=Channa striata TaxID=64152 RepID=A0AA88IW32_CHASR|nr:hypothetical protein Q5P01_025079 [Channa striata]